MCHSATVQQAYYSTQNVENAGFLGKEVIKRIRAKKRKAVAEEDQEEGNDIDREVQTDDEVDKEVEKEGDVDEEVEMEMRPSKKKGKVNKEDRKAGFSSYERTILREALCQDGPPSFINETNLEPARENFPQFDELYKELVVRKGGSKSKANNALRKSLVKKKKK